MVLTIGDGNYVYTYHREMSFSVIMVTDQEKSDYCSTDVSS